MSTTAHPSSPGKQGGESSSLEFDGTMPVPERHQINTRKLADWLRDRLPGFTGDLHAQIFKGGQSNPTYLLSSPSGTWVMRATLVPSQNFCRLRMLSNASSRCSLRWRLPTFQLHGCSASARTNR